MDDSLCAAKGVMAKQKWDNPVPMSCGHQITRASGGYLGAHSHRCGSDAFFVFVENDTAVAFRCFRHGGEYDMAAATQD